MLARPALARFSLLLVLTLAVLAGPAAASPEGKEAAAAPPNAGFELMKALVGQWEMPAQEKSPAATVIYSLVSDGTALMETMSMAENHNAMVTVYHADGDKLMMTHYCGAKNQPRMRCAKPSADGKSLEFSFVDGTNIKSDTGHMNHLTITFEDADHMTQEWTYKKGKATSKETFRFTRKAQS